MSVTYGILHVKSFAKPLNPVVATGLFKYHFFHRPSVLQCETRDNLSRRRDPYLKPPRHPITVFPGTYVPVKVIGDYDNIIRLYFCCLFIEQARKLFLTSIGAVCLRSIHEAEMVESLFKGDNYHHQSITKTLNVYDQTSMTSSSSCPPRLLYVFFGLHSGAFAFFRAFFK